MKKTIALLLGLLSVSTAFFTACNDSDNTSSAADDKSTASSAASESSSDVSEETSGGWVDGIVGYLGEGNWGREMPEFKWDRDTFTVMVYNNTRQDTYFSEEIEPNLYDTTDAIISDAVGLRNDIIRERYGVEIKAMLVDDVYTTLSQQVQAGGDDIADAAMPFLNACSTMAQAGQLYDLREFEDGGYIDLSMPWWEQNAIDSLSIANKVYFAIGDMSIMQKIVSSAIMFNKDMLALKYPELNLYQEVKDKKWTLDRLVSISKEYTYESDNEDGMTWLDTWGYGGTYGNVISFYSAAGEKLITKDSNDIPTLAVGTTEKSVKILQNILTLLEEKDTWILHAEDMGDDKWNKCVKIFGEGRNLFRSTEHVAANGHLQRAGKCLEYTLTQVVIVLTFGLDMQVTTHSHAQRLEEVLKHLCWHIPHSLTGEGYIPHKIGTATEINQHHSLALIHRQHKTVAVDTALRAESLQNSLSQSDSHILHCMVFVNLQIALT